jgi:alkanesulfonate monooxygenase SsuD/methylene tetrahydromethanopterin reductase-like flavin-dependent oxidoreductase (luciferase family)
VRRSLFTIADRFPEEMAAGRDRYGEMVELAVEADGAGLSTFWVAEHHFHPGGTCPSPTLVLAAAGAQTRRVRLGVLVSVLPFHSPLELAEQYALLDQLTGGRLELGVGSGYIPIEFEGFGVPIEEKRERFERNLALLTAAMRGEEVRLDGPAARPVRLNVAPVQLPHPPIRVAVQRREAVRFLGRKGLDIALIPYATLDSVDELAEEIREYRDELPPGARGHVAAAVHVYAGGDPAEGRSALQRYLSGRLATQSTNYQRQVDHDPRKGTAEGIEATGFAYVGPPGGLPAWLGRFERAGVDELLGIVDFGGLPARAARASARALASA